MEGTSFCHWPFILLVKSLQRRYLCKLRKEILYQLIWTKMAPSNKIDKVQGGRIVLLAHNTCGVLPVSTPTQFRLAPLRSHWFQFPTSLHWLLNQGLSVTQSKLSSSLFNMGIKTVAQWFYIHSPIFYYEYFHTYKNFSNNVDVSLVRKSHCAYIL